jgi:hypothetical protein
MGPGRKKDIKKAVKATVRAAATNGTKNPQEKIADLQKSSNAGKRVEYKVKSASAIPGSAVDRQNGISDDGSKGSSAKKAMQKRVNQSKIARGDKPYRVYVTKAEADKVARKRGNLYRKARLDGGTPPGDNSMAARQAHRNGLQWQKAETDKKSDGPKY